MNQRMHIITCHSYISVAKELLLYQGYSTLFTTEIMNENRTYLILSENLLSMPIQVKKIAADCIPLPPIKEPIYFQTNNHLCYSFRICKLKRHITPYKHMADIIIHLPYKFTKAVHSRDVYGNELLILLN